MDHKTKFLFSKINHPDNIRKWVGFPAKFDKAADFLDKVGCAVMHTDLEEEQYGYRWGLKTTQVSLPLPYGFRNWDGSFEIGDKLTAEQAFEQVMWPKYQPCGAGYFYNQDTRTTREKLNSRVFDRKVPLTQGYGPDGSYWGNPDYPDHLRVMFTADLKLQVCYWESEGASLPDTRYKSVHFDHDGNYKDGIWGTTNIEGAWAEMNLTPSIHQTYPIKVIANFDNNEIVSACAGYEHFVGLTIQEAADLF